MAECLPQRFFNLIPALFICCRPAAFLEGPGPVTAFQTAEVSAALLSERLCSVEADPPVFAIQDYGDPFFHSLYQSRQRLPVLQKRLELVFSDPYSSVQHSVAAGILVPHICCQIASCRELHKSFCIDLKG